jgi:hypothetical protein
VLHCLRAGLGADFLQYFLALVAVGVHAHLDEIVALEGAVDLGKHAGGEAVAADDDDGVELVGAAFQLLALGGR